DLPVARGLELLGEAGGWKLAVHLGRLTHPAPPATEAHALSPPGRAARVRAAGRGAGEHRASHPVEVAGEDVDHIHQPARERAELLRAGADAGVDGGALCPDELARQSADGRGLDPAAS